MDFDDLLSVAIGVFCGLIILDVILSRKNQAEVEEEHIITSKGRKLYIAEVTKRTNAVSTK